MKLLLPLATPARPALTAARALALAGLLSAGALHAQSATGTITGTVDNVGTGRFLEGARIDLPKLGLSALTDNTGRFLLPGVPAGPQDVVVTYTGLDAVHESITVTAGQQVTHNFDLTTGVYKMEGFVVEGEREGNAAAITEQRNADSVKHVVAMDAFGNLANDNAGELLLRLPGISGVHDLDGNISDINIRGTASNLNLVTVDGNLMASNFGDGRSFALRSISGSLFEEIEVTKAPTPDMPGDSIGGAINFKSASSLDMKGNERTSYKASFRWATKMFDNVPLAYEHPLHPTLELSTQRVFDVFGSQRNLGVTLNTFYSENSSGGYTGTNAYQNVLTRHAYLYDYQARDIYNNRKQKSISTRFDYRVSPSTTVNFTALVNEDDQPYNYWYIDRAVTSSQVLVTFNAAGQPTAGAIYPDYTDTFTHVRALSTSSFTTTQQLIGFNDQQMNLNAGAKHKFDRLEINYDAAMSRSHSLMDTGEHGNRPGGGNIVMTLKNVGWTIDRGVSEEYPRFTQTEGPSISDPTQYTPGTFNRRNNTKDIRIFTTKGDAKYSLPIDIPAYIKTGYSWRREELSLRNADRQWTSVNTGAGALANLVDLDHVHSSEEDRIGRQIPFIDPGTIVRDIHDNPTKWTEDQYYAATRRFIGNDDVAEDVTAGFLQGQALLFGRLKLTTGVRYERTDTNAGGYYPSSKLTTTAQRAADPVGSAKLDQGNYRHSVGSYDNFFPGVYLTYNLTKNLLLRADWSNSIGRPAFTQLEPSISIDDTARTVNIDNPSLGPQTSENWDAGVEYYFEPVGEFSFNVFRKNMHKFIVTGDAGLVSDFPNNNFGLGSQYDSYEVTTSFNGGNATIQGFEVNYQQRFEFLPKPFNGLKLSANYTWLKTNGDYGTPASTPPSTTDVVNFIPMAANVILSYQLKGWGARVMWNQTGRYLNSYNVNPALLRYTIRRDMLDAGLSYSTRRGHTFFLDVRNITNSPRSWARPAGITNAYIFYTAVNFGVRGEF